MARVNLVDVPGFEIGAFDSEENPTWDPPPSVYVEGEFLVFETVRSSIEQPIETFLGWQHLSVPEGVSNYSAVGGDFTFLGGPVSGSPTGSVPLVGLAVSFEASNEISAGIARQSDGTGAPPAWSWPPPADYDAPLDPINPRFFLQSTNTFHEGGPVTVRLRLHVEVDYEAAPDPDPDPDPDPTPVCFWTDLVNVQQHCAPAPEPGSLEWRVSHGDNGYIMTAAFLPHRELAPPVDEQYVREEFVPDSGLYPPGGVLVTPTGTVFVAIGSSVLDFDHTRLRIDSLSLYRLANDGSGNSPWLGYPPDSMEFVQDLPAIEGELDVLPGWEVAGLRGRFAIPIELPALEDGYIYVAYAEQYDTATPDAPFETKGGELYALVAHADSSVLDPIPVEITLPDPATLTNNMYVTQTRPYLIAVEDGMTGDTVDWVMAVTVGGYCYETFCFEYQISVDGAPPIDGFAQCS